MADRIERYLGRLEAELENKLDSAQLDAVMLEVECHLRESENAYVELGEPNELANRLAVENFGGIEEIRSIADHRKNPQEYAKAEFTASWMFVCLMVASTSIYYFSVSSGILYSGYEPVICFSFLPLVWLAHRSGARRWLAVWMAIGLFIALTSVGTWAIEDLLDGRIPYKLLDRTDFAIVLGSYFFLPTLVSVLLTQVTEAGHRMAKNLRKRING